MVKRMQQGSEKENILEKKKRIRLRYIKWVQR
jgi:hypothetical protein